MSFKIMRNVNSSKNMYFDPVYPSPNSSQIHLPLSISIHPNSCTLFPSPPPSLLPPPIKSSLCWMTSLEHEAWLGVWSVHQVSHHWRRWTMPPQQSNANSSWARGRALCLPPLLHAGIRSDLACTGLCTWTLLWGCICICSTVSGKLYFLKPPIPWTYSLFSPSSKWVLEPWGQGCNIDIPGSAEYSKVILYMLTSSRSPKNLLWCQLSDALIYGYSNISFMTKLI